MSKYSIGLGGIDPAADVSQPGQLIGKTGPLIQAGDKVPEVGHHSIDMACRDLGLGHQHGDGQQEQQGGADADRQKSERLPIRNPDADLGQRAVVAGEVG